MPLNSSSESWGKSIPDKQRQLGTVSPMRCFGCSIKSNPEDESVFKRQRTERRDTWTKTEKQMQCGIWQYFTSETKTVTAWRRDWRYVCAKQRPLTHLLSVCVWLWGRQWERESSSIALVILFDQVHKQEGKPSSLGDCCQKLPKLGLPIESFFWWCLHDNWGFRYNWSPNGKISSWLSLQWSPCPRALL